MKIELQRDNSQISMQVIYCNLLQVYCRLFTGYLQGVFSVRDPYLDFYSDSMPFPLNFQGMKKRVNHRRTDRRTDSHIERCVGVS